MALRGTLKDFSLAEILQLIGYQQKTGILSIEGEEDTISISFADGMVVEADSLKRHIDNRLGNLLIRAGKISPEALAPILEEQRRSRTRLGALLVARGAILPVELAAALKTQTLNLIYRIFRWSDGRYHFSQQSSVAYDAEYFTPVSTDNILMESARMIDEWPQLQKRIRSFQTVFRKAEGTESLRVVAEQGERAPGALVVSTAEAAVWKLIDGHKTITELIDSAFISDFDVVKALDEMLARQLITEVPRRETVGGGAGLALAVPHAAERHGSSIALWLIVVILFGLSAWFMPRNPANLLIRFDDQSSPLGRLRHSVSVSRLQRIDRAIEIYYLAEGRYPSGLADLSSGTSLDVGELPGGGTSDYRYILRLADGKYDLYGKTFAGSVDPNLMISRSLDPVAEEQAVRSKLLKKKEKEPEKPAKIDIVK